MEQKINNFNVVLTKIIVAHKYVYDTSSVYDCREGRKSFGLIQVLTGELHYHFYNGKKVCLKAGDLFLLKPQDCYKVTSPNVCQHYTINFEIEPNSIEGTIAEKIFLGEDITILQQEQPSNLYIDTFDEICRVWKEKNSGYQMQAISLMYKLLYHFIRKQIPLYQNNAYVKLKPAVDLLESTWNQDISLATLADACMLSVPHFRHLFTEVFETSPMGYRNSLRLLYAKDYLLRQNLSITDIAYKCGFNDVNYFSRFFKKHTGISPSKYTTL